MHAFETKLLGEINYDEDDVIQFPHGLPGFDDFRHFVAVTLEHTDPLVFLQSLEDAPCVSPPCPYSRSIRATASRSAARTATWSICPATRQPVIGSEVMCLGRAFHSRNRNHRQPAGARCGEPSQSQGRAGRRAGVRLLAPARFDGNRIRRGRLVLMMSRRAGRDHPDRRRHRGRHRAHRALARQGGHSRAARDYGDRAGGQVWCARRIWPPRKEPPASLPSLMARVASALSSSPPHSR